MRRHRGQRNFRWRRPTARHDAATPPSRQIISERTHDHHDSARQENLAPAKVARGALVPGAGRKSVATEEAPPVGQPPRNRPHVAGHTSGCIATPPDISLILRAFGRLRWCKVSLVSAYIVVIATEVGASKVRAYACLRGIGGRSPATPSAQDRPVRRLRALFSGAVNRRFCRADASHARHRR
jgi:hypothetical protein